MLGFDWKEVGDVAFYVATFVTVLFAGLYLFLAPWWKTTTGQNIMAVMGSMALAFTYFSWAIYAGGIPEGFHVMRAVIFAMITGAVGWRTVIFIRHHLIPSLRGERNVEQVRQDLDGTHGRSDHGSDRGLP
jgi:hypothetical protein